MASERVRLMIPGPVDVEDDVLAAMGEPVQAHYGEAWLPVYNEVVDQLRRLFRTAGDLFLMPGAGSAGLDAALGSLTRTGEKVLVPANGFFGRRMGTLARAWGLDALTPESPWDRPLDPEEIRRVLASEPGIQALLVVHLETSTGVLNPLRDIAAVAGEVGVPVVVDAVSSLGGVPLPVDEWGIDVCVTVANKCLGCPPGLALVSAGPRAWDVMRRKPARGHGWYLDLEVWRDYAVRWAAWHPYPITLPSPNILALRASLRRILGEGVEAHYARFARAADAVRRGLYRLGFSLYADEAYASPLITAARPRPGLDVEDLRRSLLADWHILVAGGLEELRGQILRVGHIGRASSPEYVERLLAGVEAYVRARA